MKRIYIDILSDKDNATYITLSHLHALSTVAFQGLSPSPVLPVHSLDRVLVRDPLTTSRLYRILWMKNRYYCLRPLVFLLSRRP